MHQIISYRLTVRFVMRADDEDQIRAQLQVLQKAGGEQLQILLRPTNDAIAQEQGAFDLEISVFCA